MRPLLAIVATSVLLAVLTPARARAQGDTPDVVLGEARRLFEALDYERAVTVLDRAVALLEARTPKDADATTRTQLAEAYELRGRARFGLNDREGTRADFRLLVHLDPGRTLAGVSPNVVALLEEVRKALVGGLNLTVSPADADVDLDGMPMPKTPGRQVVVAGAHVLTIAKPGYRTATENITIALGPGSTDLTVTLERVSAIITVATSPAEVEVVVDGASRGTTSAGPPPPDFPAGGIPLEELSKPLLLLDVATGSHVVEFRKPCYVSAQRRLDVERPADYRIDPVRLLRAVGQVSVGPAPGGSVFLDGVRRGAPPMTIADVCEGQHAVEVRSPLGRSLTRLDVHTGDTLAVTPVLKPAVAILSVLGLPEAPRGVDPRQAVERAFQPLRTMTLLALPGDEVSAVLAKEKLPPDWLSFDAGRRPVGDTAASITAAARQELSDRLARGLDAQGVAVLTAVSKDDPSRFVLTLLAAGSGEPDTIDVKLNDADSIGRAMARLDSSVPLFHMSVGVQAIDVLDRPGAVVVAVDPLRAGSAPVVAPGEVIVAAGGQPVQDVARFNQLVAAAKPGDRLSLDVRDLKGAMRKAEVQAERVPEAFAITDQMLLFNPLVLDLRRQASQADAGNEPVVRLNLAIALLRAGDAADARAELEKVRLPDGPGVGGGTVRYLLGLCHEAVGDFQQAEAAWKAAAAAKGAMLTTDGPMIKELAERKLADLARRVRH